MIPGRLSFHIRVKVVAAFRCRTLVFFPQIRHLPLDLRYINRSTFPPSPVGEIVLLIFPVLFSLALSPPCPHTVPLASSCGFATSTGPY